jgi:hypothetical protein
MPKIDIKNIEIWSEDTKKVVKIKKKKQALK